jgi:hypothetical protein
VVQQEVVIDCLKSWVVKLVIETDLDTFGMVVGIVVALIVEEDQR